MNVSYARLSAALLLLWVGSAPAADPGEVYLEQCRVQLVERFGEDVEFKLVSMRRSAGAMLLKVAVSAGASESGRVSSRFTTCRLSTAPVEAHTAPRQEAGRGDDGADGDPAGR